MVDSKLTESYLRPPIVTVLGHVDHGKTTLLDAIRKTNIAAKEVGGITQSIGASMVTTKEGKRITFIDTPGHAAFANMRSQGAKVADIAILVVAADDGVKPQTKEALEYILDAKIPFIVAATKIDLPHASVDKVRDQLEKESVAFEARGGDIPLVSVSGKTGKGVDGLLDMISLVSELNNVSGDPESSLEAVVIETGKDKRGTYVSLVVTNGTLKVADQITTTTVSTKVRGIFDYQGKQVSRLLPGEPGQILGFSEPPPVGSRVWKIVAGQTALPQENKGKPLMQKIKKDELPVVIKAKNAGSLEAVIKNLPDKVVVVYAGVGDVNESDVFVAKSADADIFAFESKASKSVINLADTEGIKINKFDIIYKLFDELKKIVDEGKIEVLGRAEIIKIFPFDNKKVAGCKVVEGRINKNDQLTLVRNDKELGNVKIVSMKKEKENVSEVRAKEEFGIIITPQLEFRVSDMIISLRK